MQEYDQQGPDVSFNTPAIGPLGLLDYAIWYG